MDIYEALNSALKADGPSSAAFTTTNTAAPVASGTSLAAQRYAGNAERQAINSARAQRGELPIPNGVPLIHARLVEAQALEAYNQSQNPPTAPTPPNEATVGDLWVARWGEEVAPAVHTVASKLGLSTTPLDYNSNGQAVDQHGNAVANAPSFEVYRDMVNAEVNRNRGNSTVGNPTGQKFDPNTEGVIYNPYATGYEPSTGATSEVVNGISIAQMNEKLKAAGKPLIPTNMTQAQAQKLYEAAMGRDLEYDEKPFEIDPEKPEDSLASIIRMEDARKKEFFDPVEEALAKSANERNILARARTATSQGYQDLGARNERERQRYGLGASTLANQQNTKASRLAQGATNSTVMNNARVQEYDRSNMINEQLANNSRALMGFSIDGFSNSANLKSTRNATAEQLAAKSQIAGIGQDANKYTTQMGMISGGIGSAASLGVYKLMSMGD